MKQGRFFFEKEPALCFFLYNIFSLLLIRFNQGQP